MTHHELVLAATLVLAALGQLMLKLGSNRADDYRGALFSPYTLAGYGFFGLTLLGAPYALLKLDLATVTASTALVQIMVLGLSRWVLGEDVSKRRAMGVGLLALGVVVYASGL